MRIELIWDMGPGRGKWDDWEIGTDMYTLPCVKQLVGSCSIAQGAHHQCSVMT